MNLRISRSVIGAVLIVLAVAPAAEAAPAQVTIRVEGQDRTLVREQALTTSTRTINKDGRSGHDCTGTSALGALDTATGGNWDGTWSDFGPGYLVHTILGEVHGRDFTTDSSFYEFWLNEQFSEQGLCGKELQSGDRVLLFVSRCEFDQQTFQCTNPPVRPLQLLVPTKATRGTPTTLTVLRLNPDGSSAPEPGVAVQGGGASGTSDSNGRVALAFSNTGNVDVRASSANRAGDTRTICVTTGSDGLCGSSSGTGSTGGATGGSGSSGGSTGGGPATTTTLGRVSRAFIGGIENGQRFARGRGPRVLSGDVQVGDAGVRHVKLRLRRQSRGRCSYFSGRRERFVGMRCGRVGSFFRIGDRARWSYLLPSRLPRGRYVLQLRVIDRDGRLDSIERGRTQVVFHVR